VTAGSIARGTVRPVGGGNLDGGFGQYMAMLQTRTDAEAIAESRADPEWFGVIFDRHFAPIHRYLHRRVGRQLADDLAAETFAQAFRQRDRYDLRAPDARPWLFGIAANLLRRHRRTERRRLFAYARTGVDTRHSDLDDADERMDAHAMWRRMALALASLRAADREVVLLFAWADLSYEEIAAALDVPVGTVRSRLHRGRRRLRDLLRPEGASPAHPDEEGERDG
jgi:RNA polymerase sigma-70 factor, ECF subfamily